MKFRYICYLLVLCYSCNRTGQSKHSVLDYTIAFDLTKPENVSIFEYIIKYIF